MTDGSHLPANNDANPSVTREKPNETEPVAGLRYFAFEVNPDAPAMGANRKHKFN